MYIGNGDIKVFIHDVLPPYEFEWPRYENIINGHCFLIVYAINDRESFEKVEHHLNSITRHKKIDFKEVPCILIGNKVDRDVDRQVAQNELEKLAKKYNFLHYEITARFLADIELIFNKIIEITLPRLVQLSDLCEQLEQGVVITDPKATSNGKKKKCTTM